MRSRTISLCSIATLIMSAAGAAHAQARDTLSALLIDESLSPRKVQIVAFEGNQLVFLDSLGAERRITIDRLAAVVAVDPRADVRDGIGANAAPALGQQEETMIVADADETGVLQLTDGQHFPGTLVPAVSEEEVITWQHGRFGDMRVSLDIVSGFFRSDIRTTRAVRDSLPSEDELYLVNGDILRGFLAGLGDPVTFEAGNQVVELEPQRVAGARLANPRTNVSGLVVWLNDGTVAALDSIVSRRDRDLVVTLPEGQAGVYDITDLRGVAFDAARIRNLADLQPTMQAPVGERLYVEPIRLLRHPDSGDEVVDPLNSRDVLLPGPMEVTWDLPDRTERFAGTASLVYGTAPWGDCEFVIRLDDVEHFRTRLNPDTPVMPFNIPVNSASRMSITIEPGAFGPIHDRVIIHRPTILLEAGGA